MPESELVQRYRVADGRAFRMSAFSPSDTAGFGDNKAEAKALLANYVERLAELQERLYAEHQWALLIILQGTDTSGKDGVVEHVMSGVNPLGCSAHSFKAPTQHELDHDFLWRSNVALPRRGHIGIFNRSYYEEILVVRLHPELLAKQQIPGSLVTDDIWQQRFQDIVSYERYLKRNGIVPIKFYLHLSKEEQRRRLLARIENPDKHWKFSMGDTAERRLWDQYAQAYEDMIQNTATADVPWHVVPADNKWFTRLVVAATLVDVLTRLDPQIPKLGQDALAGLEEARQALEADR